MLDHVGLAVSDIAKSRAFYEAALKPIGMEVLMTSSPEQTESGGSALMFGKPGEEPSFVIADNERVGQGNHVAFEANSREEVEAFHAAALAAGGTDNGAPGFREKYAPNYYAAFVLDPDGFNVEAVFHA